MNRQEMATITSRLAANAEMVMMNNENLQVTSQNAVMIRDQELANMQSQITEFAGNMRQKDLEIEDLKRKLRDQIAYAGKLKTLSYSMDLDAKMSLRDSELTLKSEITEQRRLMSNYEHECISERMIADQLRRDKSMILDILGQRGCVKAVMENFKAESSELSEINYQLRLRITEKEERAEKQREETERRTNPLPLWAVRLVPGCIIEYTEAVNMNAVAGAARVIDVVIITHLKARYKSFYSFMVDMDATEYEERVSNQGTIPEFDGYYPYLGTDKNGELKAPTEGDMKAIFAKKKSKDGENGDCGEETRKRFFEKQLARESCAG